MSVFYDLYGQVLYGEGTRTQLKFAAAKGVSLAPELGSPGVITVNPCRARHWSEGFTSIHPFKPHNNPSEMGSVITLILQVSKETQRGKQSTER